MVPCNVPRKVVVPTYFRMARRVAGLSQAALAAKAEVSISFVAMIELGLRSPRPERADRLASAMGVDSDLFMRDYR